MFAAVIALNAYSDTAPNNQLLSDPITPLLLAACGQPLRWESGRSGGGLAMAACQRTDLIQSSLLREDCNVSVVACAAYYGRLAMIQELSGARSSVMAPGDKLTESWLTRHLERRELSG